MPNRAKPSLSDLLRTRAANGKPDAPNNGQGGPNGGGGKKPAPNLQPSRGLFGVLTMVLLAVFLFVMLNSLIAGKATTLDEFKVMWQNHQLKNVVITDEAVRAERLPDASSPSSTYITIPLNTSSREAIAKEVIQITDGQVTSKSQPTWVPFLYWFGPFIILLAVFWFVSRGLRNASVGGGMLGSFGKSRHRMMNKEMTGITFVDVAGIDEAKDEVGEIIEFLKNPKKFTKLGGRIPRGVLLIGEPGCGKTLLAKAIAGEADVPFFSISGSDLV